MAHENSRRKRRRDAAATDRGLQLHLVLHAQLGSSTEKLVLMVLLDYYGQNQLCCPSHQTIAECANLSRRSVIRSIARLADLGVISITGRIDEAGDRTSNAYHIHFDRLRELQPVQEDAAGSDSVSPPKSEGASDVRDSGGGDTASLPRDGASRRVVTDCHHGGDGVSQEPPNGTAHIEPNERASGSCAPKRPSALPVNSCAHAAEEDSSSEVDGRMSAAHVDRLRERLRSIDIGTLTPVLALEAMGLDPPQARRLSDRYEPGRIRRVCSRVRDWILDKSHAPIENPAGLVSNMLRDRSHDGELTDVGRLAKRIESVRDVKRGRASRRVAV